MIYMTLNEVFYEYLLRRERFCFLGFLIYSNYNNEEKPIIFLSVYHLKNLFSVVSD